MQNHLMLILHYAPDNASLIVRLALEELGLTYETRLVDRRIVAQKSPAYLAVNPMGLIPALETPDGPIFETAAILLWLSEQSGQMAPPPHSPLRGAFLSWLFATSNGLHADLRHMFYAKRYADDPTAHRRRTQQRICAHLDRLNALAPVPFLGGDTLSVLDLYVATMLRWMALYPKGDTAWFDLTRWPRLQDIARRVEARPSMAAAIRAEGLGPTPLTAPVHITPPEGSAL